MPYQTLEILNNRKVQELKEDKETKKKEPELVTTVRWRSKALKWGG